MTSTVVVQILEMC
nr:unnamed protein product [Callosobruchus analis]